MQVHASTVYMHVWCAYVRHTCMRTMQRQSADVLTKIILLEKQLQLKERQVKKKRHKREHIAEKRKLLMDEC